MDNGKGYENADKTVSQRLVDIAKRSIDTETRRAAILHLIDWMGCSIAGRKTEAGGVFRNGIDRMDWGGDPVASAFSNGSLGSILEMDDVHRTAILHPGPVVMPAALSLADDGDPARFLDAIVLGYEAMIRLGRSVGAAHYAFFHNTSTCGGVGSAMAASHLLELDDERRVWAIGNAMTLAAGLWQCRNEPVLTKPLHVAEAARRGVQAAVMAARGLSGPARIFEGPQGFFAALAKDGNPEKMFAEDGSGWLIFETSFKPWPACRHAHAAIDAALALRPAIAGRAIREIHVESYSDAVVFCDRVTPVTSGEAKFSLQHACAVVFAKGEPELDDFQPEVLGRADYVELRQKTSVAASQKFTSAYPAHFGAAVSVTLEDGDKLAATIDDALGDTENPMDESAVIGKFHTLAAWAGLSVSERDVILDRAWGLLEGQPASALKAVLLPHL